jgi:glycosyltransferase involved in cell wall biosynthesis
MIKVGLVLIINDNWLGGVNYYRNLTNAVYSLPNRNIEFVIFTDTKFNNKYLQDFKHLDIIRTSLFDRFSLTWIIRKLCIRLLKNDFLLIRLLKKNNINVLSHSGWLGKKSDIPTLGWIPDFQHLHLPNFFTKKECNVRNRAFRDLCNICSKVIVSSQDALKDLLEFSPKSVDKAIVLRFAVPFKKDITQLPSLDELENTYEFKRPFFLLPNQFWAHKNHKIVIKALGILKKQNVKTTVLVTGNTHDPRQPDFFSSLEELIAIENVREEFKVLGMIPKTHLDSLFFHADAIINPSLFEGWSTSVEEAKALGKRILLSNIPIHQEQKPKLGIYFDPYNDEGFAKLLKENSNLPNNNNFSFTESKEAFMKFGLAYQEIVERISHKI